MELRGVRFCGILQFVESENHCGYPRIRVQGRLRVRGDNPISSGSIARPLVYRQCPSCRGPRFTLCRDFLVGVQVTRMEEKELDGVAKGEGTLEKGGQKGSQPPARERSRGRFGGPRTTLHPGGRGISHGCFLSRSTWQWPSTLACAVGDDCKPHCRHTFTVAFWAYYSGGRATSYVSMG